MYIFLQEKYIRTKEREDDVVEKLKRINAALPDLMCGIGFFGILAEIVGVWFAGDKWNYTASLWLGILFAELMAYHMAWTLNIAVDIGRGNAEKMMKKQNLLRYAVLLIAFGIILLTGWINPLFTFLGIMGLKVGAYIQPFTHKLITKLNLNDKEVNVWDKD